jgi:hypothetical protein
VNVRILAGTTEGYHGALGLGFKGGDIEGGGVVGVRSNKGPAMIGEISGNVFRGVDVGAVAWSFSSNETSKSSGNIKGGGVIGAYSSASVAIQGISGNRFDGIRVSAEGVIAGGGVAGINAVKQETNSSVLGGFAGNSVTRSSVYAGYGLQGGGVVGVTAASAASGMTFTAITELSGNLFEGILVESDRYIRGGGVVGLYGTGGDGVMVLDSLHDTVFRGITVNTGGDAGGAGITPARGTYIAGGGILGLLGSSGSFASVSSVENAVFEANRVNSGAYIDGGGIIGVNVTDVPAFYSSLQTVKGSVFRDNAVSAENGWIMGGALYTYGLISEMAIIDSVFEDNAFTAAIDEPSVYASGPIEVKARVYGTVTVDTGRARADSAPNTVVLEATPGKKVVFSGNTVADGFDPAAAPRASSLYFGTRRWSKPL